MKLLWLSLAALLTTTCTEAQKTFEVLEGPHKSFSYWQDRCKLLGGRLAIINNEQDQTAAQIALKTTGKGGVLTGMRRVRPHEHFVNGDGETLSYTNWWSGEPNDHGNGEECLEIYVHGNAFGRWNDVSCSRDAALCEFEPLEKTFALVERSSRQTVAQWKEICKQEGGRLATLTIPSERQSAANALEGWIGARRACDGLKHMFQGGGSKTIACHGRVALCEFAPKTYSLVEERGHALSYDQWRAKCQARGAQLGRINSADEQRRAFRVIKTTHMGSVLIDSKRKSRGSPIFQNSDGETTTYTNWNNGEPNNGGGHQSCTHVYAKGGAAGRWDDIHCSHVKAALCESRKFARNIHYFILKENRDLTYRDWENKCQAKGGHLASIRNGEEQALAEKALKTTRRGALLTGMKREVAHSKTFVDIYGHVIGFSNWLPGQPDDYHGEDCIEIKNEASNFGKWNDLKCRRNTALCEMD